MNFSFAAEAAVPKLKVGLADRDSDVRKAMAACLGRFGAVAEPAVPDLLPLLADGESKVREVAADALRQIGPQTVPALIEIVSQWYTKPKADIHWSNYPDTWSTLTDLEKLARLESSTKAALQVLGNLGSEASVAVPTIALALADSNSGIKSAAVQALGNIDRNWASDPVLADAIASLTGQLSRAEKPGEIAVQMFTAMGSAAVPVLIDALESGNRVTRENAAKALGGIGPRAKAAIPALNKALEDNNGWVQDEAKKALAKINDPAT